MPGRGDEVVDVLGDAVRVVPWKHGFEVILGRAAYGEARAIPITHEIVAPEMIGLPELDAGLGNHVAARVDNSSGDSQRQTWISGGAQGGGIGAFGRALL